MARISSTIAIYDKVSAPINNMISALSDMCDAYESVERSMGQGFDTSKIVSARAAIDRAAESVTQLGRNTDNAEDEQKEYNRSVSSGSSAMDGLVGKVTSFVAAYASLQTVKKAINLSDEMALSTSRLGLLVEGEQEVARIQEEIYNSAQRSRGEYQATVDTVAKLGITAMQSFKNMDEIVAFSEILNKSFVVGGASATEQASAMYQLTQAMASGRLQGDEYRSIIENAPLLARSIEDYMRNVQGATGSMKEWASEGLLTADVIKAAVFRSADEVEARFEQMPLTWGQTWTTMKNQALMSFQPVLEKLNSLVNNAEFQQKINHVMSALSKLATFAIGVIDVIAGVASFMYDNWSWISPIIYTVIGALLMYKAVMAITKGIEMASAVAKGLLAAAKVVCTGATWAEVTAQYALNSAMYACPLVWIIMLIMAVIGIIYLVINAIKELTGTASSGFGMICGSINVVIQFFKNLALSIANIALGIVAVLGALRHNIIAVFWNAICSVQSFWWGLLETVMNVIAGICKLLNKLPFIEFDYSGITNKADEYASRKAAAESSKMEYQSLGEAFNKGFNTFDTFEDGWVSDAYDSGAAWGDGVADSFSSTDTNTANSFDPNTYGAGYDETHIPDNIATTAENTGKAADNLDITSEDLKYLRDIAERDVINRFTTAEIKVEMNNNNTINSDTDIDGIVDYLVNGVSDAMEIVAEGVPA